MTVSDTQGSESGARRCELLPCSAVTAASRRSAEDVIEAISDFLLNGEDSVIEVIDDRSIFLPALRFEGGLQGSDFRFESINLDLSLGYSGLRPNLFCIRRYVG